MSGDGAKDNTESTDRLHRRVPVSYTHLDVYKRQALPPPNDDTDDFFGSLKEQEREYVPANREDY